MSRLIAAVLAVDTLYAEADPLFRALFSEFLNFYLASEVTSWKLLAQLGIWFQTWVILNTLLYLRHCWTTPEMEMFCWSCSSMLLLRQILFHVFFFAIFLLVDLSVFDSLLILNFKFKKQSFHFGGGWTMLWISLMVRRLFRSTNHQLPPCLYFNCWKPVTSHSWVLYTSLSVTSVWEFMYVFISGHDSWRYSKEEMFCTESMSPRFALKMAVL